MSNIVKSGKIVQNALDNHDHHGMVVVCEGAMKKVSTCDGEK